MYVFHDFDGLDDDPKIVVYLLRKNTSPEELALSESVWFVPANYPTMYREFLNT